MVMQYSIAFNITSVDEAELLSAIVWVKDNHGTKVSDATADGTSFLFNGHIIELTYTDMTTTVSALKTQFTTRLTWSVGLRYVS